MKFKNNLEMPSTLFFMIKRFSSRLRNFIDITTVMWVAGTLTASEDSADSPLLTLNQIFASSEFSSKSFGSYQWNNEGPWMIRLKKDKEGSGMQVVQVNPVTEEEIVLVESYHLIPPGETEPLNVEEFVFSDDRSKMLVFTHSKKVWRYNTRGDYWILDVTSRELKKIGGDVIPSTLMFASFSPNGRKVAYVHENDLYVQNIRTGTIKRLTQKKSENIINGTFDWVYEEEFGLRKGYRWSPDSQFIAYWQLNTDGIQTFHLINNTESLYPRLIPIKYPKVGETNPSVKVGVIYCEGGPTRWLQIPGDSRNNYIGYMEWVENPTAVVVQQLNRLQNHVKVMEVDPVSGQAKTIHEDSDAAWLDLQDDLHWFNEDRNFLWLSERTGWRQVYSVARKGSRSTLLTDDSFDAIEISGFDEKQGLLYFSASPKNATQRYLFKVGLDGSNLARITPDSLEGSSNYSISPDGRWAIHRHSSFTSPPMQELVELPKHLSAKILETNDELVKKLDGLKLGETEFFRIDIGDGVELDGWCIKPPDFDADRKYPVLFYVYGEPAGTTAVDRWSGKRILWHQMLAQKGYLIMNVDNRGTPSPRGREWRKIVYRQIGILASADQAAAVKALGKERPYMDADRIAITGWSGGGSMSLNALFRYPDLYHTAMAVAFISNQRFYDSIYQERYMGLPHENVDGFRDGSPINFAHQLKGNLLILHGTGDDNCHYQNTEALINELVHHNKPFSMMSYPNRSHSISEGKNTSLHVYGTMTRFLIQNTPPGEY
ncbi:MAG TPA: S9 family peptidase [Verrucomicrobiales bacterium]|nr:S9 family peptidase [Verrucomicrobiales bacterium]HIL69962.1 S9 family peptidase [Verrucomicrobiota bacterium]